jgi:hypothetical protein
MFALNFTVPYSLSLKGDEESQEKWLKRKQVITDSLLWKELSR